MSCPSALAINPISNSEDNLHTHWLFIASTPRHLYQAVALSILGNHSCSVVLFDLDSDSPLVAEATTGHYFDNAIILTRPKESNRRRTIFAQQQVQICELIDNIQPTRVYTGNDFQPLSQWTLHYAKQKSDGVDGIYLDEGTATYVTGYNTTKRIGKSLEGYIKRLSYGSWYRRPKKIGSSKYIDERWVDFPKLDSSSNAKQLNPALFSSDAFEEFATNVATRIGYNSDLLKDTKLLFIVPHLSMMRRLYGGLDQFQTMIRALHNSGHNIALKMHPRTPDGLGLDNLPIHYIPPALPAELVFTLLPPGARVIGDLSSAMISAIRILGTERVISIDAEESAFSRQMQDVLHYLDANVVALSELNNQLG